MMDFIREEKLDLTIQILKRLKSYEVVSFKEYKTLLENAYNLFSSNNDTHYNLGLSVICHVAESKPQDKFIQQLLFDCIISSRVYLYNDMFNRIVRNSEAVQYSTFDAFSEAVYTLETGTILTRDQKKVFDDFKRNKRLVVSAPTSFGKSKIVSEIIIDNSYLNIAIILPTIALLNETYQSFRRNPYIFNRYNLINTLTQTINETNNIFILTPEKMDLLLDSHPFLNIDFFVMDEIYKIQDDEDRKQVFTHCLYRLSKMEADFYLIGPYFRTFSANFLKKTNAIFERYTAEIVQKDTLDISSLKDNENYKISNGVFKKLRYKDRNLVNIISEIEGQTLIYSGRKDSVENISIKLIDGNNEKVESNELIDFIKTNIAEDWSLVHCLEKRIAFHHGAIPKYIQTEIVDSFNSGIIDVLVCTTTLTEGVNTSAKNIIIYDNYKGKKDTLLSGFDVKNIKGRAGRFLAHFIGRVIILESVSEEKEKDTIEFSYYDNDNLTPEETIQIDKSDLDYLNLENRNITEQLLFESNIPLELIIKNKFIPIHKQVSLIDFLRVNSQLLIDILFTTGIPPAEKLDIILDLCYRFLFNEKDYGNRMFPPWELNRLTKYYLYYSPPLKELIATQYSETDNIDVKVRRAFTLISHFFEFALPKYFMAFESLYNFVYMEMFQSYETISMITVVTKLEFGFINKHEISLKEAGVPVNIINKISHELNDCVNIEMIKKKLQFNPQILAILSNFERSIFNKYV